ncbi:MAG: hypothetical protein ABSF12_02000 [Bryobacteraceae bacterium]|jgi:hypothetical protein
MKTILCLFVMMLAPTFAQYRIYSEWVPTNESGVEYRWVVDNEYPRACTVQFRDLYKDGESLVRASINFRNFNHPAAVRIAMPVTNKSGESRERILLSCTFLDHVYVEPTLRRSKLRL